MACTINVTKAGKVLKKLTSYGIFYYITCPNGDEKTCIIKCKPNYDWKDDYKEEDFVEEYTVDGVQCYLYLYSSSPIVTRNEASILFKINNLTYDIYLIGATYGSAELDRGEIAYIVTSIMTRRYVA